jgi:hypothetical protein
MIWDHKTAPYLEIKPMQQAKQFAKLTQRFGAGVTVSLTTSKEMEYKNLNGISPWESV